jgi:hypothetical protein
MLKTIVLIFILSVDGSPDLFHTQTFARGEHTVSCENTDYIEPNLLIWGIRVQTQHPSYDLGPDSLTYECLEIDHVDPDVQPSEDSA